MCGWIESVGRITSRISEILEIIPDRLSELHDIM
jgi:hypothetical protein